LHNQNLINLSNQILEEKSIFDGYKKREKKRRNIENNQESKNVNVDEIIEKFITNNEKNKEEKEALVKLNDEYSINLEEFYEKEEFCLKLRGAKNEAKYPKLGDDGFKYISQIRFKDLIEINLSNNNISDISYLNNMLLPHLEILNFSDNQIVDITPVANLISKYLSDIYLQNNQIEDITPFENAKFPRWSLEILRLDGNNFNKNEQENQKNQDNKSKKDIQKLVAIFGKKVFYEKKGWDDFNKKYNCSVDEKDEKLDLGSKRNGDIIADLLPLVTSPNKIKVLILDNDKITDANYLTKMPLYYLTYLDLSLNNITNINFVKVLAVKCKNLKVLYLHDNKINDLTSLMNYDKNELIFETLETLTLKNNSLNLNDSVTKEILTTLAEKLTFDYKKDEIPQIPQIPQPVPVMNVGVKPEDDQFEEHGGEIAAKNNAKKNSK
jgi:Leucine-rich repeat (LRR) protein